MADAGRRKRRIYQSVGESVRWGPWWGAGLGKEEQSAGRLASMRGARLDGKALMGRVGEGLGRTKNGEKGKEGWGRETRRGASDSVLGGIT